MLTSDDIVKAIAEAGFDNAADLVAMLKTSRLLVQRNQLTYVIGAKQAQSQADAQTAQAAIQQLQQQIAAIDTQLTQGV